MAGPLPVLLHLKQWLEPPQTPLRDTKHHSRGSGMTLYRVVHGICGGLWPEVMETACPIISLSVQPQFDDSYMLSTSVGP